MKAMEGEPKSLYEATYEELLELFKLAVEAAHIDDGDAPTPEQANALACQVAGVAHGLPEYDARDFEAVKAEVTCNLLSKALDIRRA